MSEKYNGWANRATWAVHLWSSTDEGVYRMSRRLSKAQIIAELKEIFLLENHVDNPAILDIYDCSNEIDWDEIADAFVEEDQNEDT